MTSPSSTSEKMAEVVRSYHSRTKGAETSRADASRFVGGAQDGLVRRRARRKNVRVVALAALSALAVVFAFVSLKPFAPPPSIEYLVDGTGPRSGDRLSAGAAPRTLDLHGGRLVLAEGSSVLIEENSKETTRTRLADGLLTAMVTPTEVPDPERNWHVLAGPFDVRVVGTVFSVRWQRERGRVEVSVERGEVQVTGPGLSVPKRVAAGEAFAATDSAPVSPPARTEKTTRLREPLKDAALAETPRKQLPAKPSWRKLADAGDHKASLAAAESEGIENLVRQLGPRQLLRLADIARMGGKLKMAVELLKGVRERFAGSSHSALSAYTLARIAFDGRGDLSLAIRWFDVYLTENPGGPLAREALARKLEAEHRSGRPKAASDSARRYLKKYPKGAHRKFAQDVLRAGE